MKCYALVSWFFLNYVVNGSLATRIVDVYWNTTNSMFRIDNTDNVIDVNRGNLPWEYDQANIICPLYRRGTREADMETFIIYNVSKEEYESCRILNPKPRVIAVCNKPHKFMYFTITFRSFTPTPGGLEFVPGRDYYFISTSSRGDLYRRVGGRCSTHNMKVVFKMADQPVETEAEYEEYDEESSPAAARPNLKEDPNYWYPTHELTEIESNSVDHKKRSETSHNEVIKQEALQNNHGISFRPPIWTFLLSFYLIRTFI